MKRSKLLVHLMLLTLLLLGLTLSSHPVPARAGAGPIMRDGAFPPFDGTIFLDPDIIIASDPTTFASAPYAGEGVRMMFDRRVEDWVSTAVFLFNGSFTDGLTAEIQVNAEFGSVEAAAVEAEKYGRVIGQLPHVLRTQVKTVWIHQGVELFGGGNQSILIHTGQSVYYEEQGILEETLVHEAAHTSLDETHASSRQWIAAQYADGNFISTYARDNPVREDVAESFLPYLAYRVRPGRITPALATTFIEAMPHRINYFDAQAFDLTPLVAIPDLVANADTAATPLNTSVTITPLDNDEVNSDELTIILETLPEHGTVRVSDLTLVYTPTSGFEGVDTIQYTLNTFAESATASVTVTVGQ